MPTVSFTLNGSPVTVPCEPGMHLLELLREECGITSTKDGCAPQGFCGCCAVLLDGRPALACLLAADRVAERPHRYLIERYRRFLSPTPIREPRSAGPSDLTLLVPPPTEGVNLSTKAG